MKNLNKIGIALIVVAVITIIVWALLPGAIPVQVAEVQRGTFQQVVEEEGKTRVRDRYVITAPVSGELMRIALKAGNAVTQNAIVATIVPNPPALLDARAIDELTERVGAAESTKLRAIADASRAQATLEKSSTDLVRFKTLAAKGFISATQLAQNEMTFKVNQRELDAAKQAVQIADHELGNARAALSRSQNHTATEYFQVHSPVAGNVLRVLQESAGSVAMGAALLELGDPNNIEVVVDVLSSDAVQIKKNDDVNIVRWGQAEPLAGKVSLVEPSAFTKISALGVEEQRVNVIIDIVSPHAQWSGLSDGFRVVADIVVFTAKDVITVPTAALFKKEDQWHVFVADGGRARERAVTISRRSGQHAVVENGLQTGEKVIEYPGDTIKNGVRIHIS